jgi:hypothetical protein
MAQSPMTLTRLFAISWCAVPPLATGACSQHHSAAESAAPVPEPRGPVTLRVTNSNWSDVRIYLVRGAMWVRLGMVTTNGTAEFMIPADLLSGAGTVTLVADPVAAKGSWRSALPVISPGDEFELVVENFLQYSHLVVR